MATPFSGLPPIILFVCEDAGVLPVYTPPLEHAGMWVASSTKPVEALSAVHELKPDIIVADIDLTEGSAALTFIGELATSGAALAIPVIAISQAQSEDAPPAVRDRTALWVPKPVLPDVLVANVQQLLVEGYATRMRADREQRRLQDLAGRSNSLAPDLREADRLASATRTCPACAQPLEWIENGRIGTVCYDYYHWCASGCGLYCYDLDSHVWVRLAPATDDGQLQVSGRAAETPRSNGTAVSILTDQAGYITAIDPAGAKLINYSARHAIGTSLLPFVHQGRQQVLEDLRRVGDVESPSRSVVWWPRDRKPRSARISIRATEEGIQWTIDAEPVPPKPPKRARSRRR